MAAEQARCVALAADVAAHLHSFKQHRDSLESWVKQRGYDKVVLSNESGDVFLEASGPIYCGGLASLDLIKV